MAPGTERVRDAYRVVKTLYRSCNISNIARCVTHSNKANTVLYVWKLHCAGRKTHSLTKSKLSLVSIDGFSLNFTNYKQGDRLETAITFDSLVCPTSEKICDFTMHNVYWDKL